MGNFPKYLKIPLDISDNYSIIKAYNTQHLLKVTTMKSYNITYVSPINGRETMELEVSADRLFDRDGETWFRYDVTPF